MNVKSVPLGARGAFGGGKLSLSRGGTTAQPCYPHFVPHGHDPVKS